MGRLSMVLGLAAFAGLDGVARADEAAMAAGPSWSVEGSLGGSHTRFSSGFAVGETAALGFYLTSSENHALSGEVVENAVIVDDGKTPQVGYVGLGLRNLSKLAHPPAMPVDAVLFERVAGGLAFSTDGQVSHVGAALDATLGGVLWGSSGVSIHATAYLFDASHVTGDMMVVIGASYVLSPIHNAPPFRPYEASPPQHPRACPDEAAYRAALATQRGEYAEECAAAPSAECDDRSAAIRKLLAGLNACLSDLTPFTKPAFASVLGVGVGFRTRSA